MTEVGNEDSEGTWVGDPWGTRTKKQAPVFHVDKQVIKEHRRCPRLPGKSEESALTQLGVLT